jgi:hypothetical protein
MAGFVILVAGAGLVSALRAPPASAFGLRKEPANRLGLFAIFQSACTRQSNIKKARHKGELI